MNTKREIIKRIKKGEALIIYFPDDSSVYTRGMSEIDKIGYHLIDLEDMAKGGLPQLLLVTVGVAKITENLQAMQDSYGAVAEAEQIINPEE